MKLNKCPYCEKPAMSLLKKAFIQPIGVYKCLSCGGRVGLDISQVLTVMFLFIFVGVGIGARETPWLIVPLVVVLILAQSFYFPLVERNEKDDGFEW